MQIKLEWIRHPVPPQPIKTAILTFALCSVTSVGSEQMLVVPCNCCIWNSYQQGYTHPPPSRLCLPAFLFSRPMYGQQLTGSIVAWQIVVPRTFPEFTSRRVLTTSWLEGEKLSGSKAADVGELVNLGVICYLKQLLDTGFFHVSPPPGHPSMPWHQLEHNV